ncbi:uncharacterized protein N7496_006000 [Penicillium cataractarum]|uniref:Uncharacterized protein n=1 Tax=Penicillium cataractarum TaxID=2100454 RepID=A0A9W9V5Q7_9EURO|nr:uncharacterized protein N7496_006000 [Penicillium cataractarum]KAJ5369908.1 hypothetical protein N7496_006000 [Penicillium cataractarum]
MSIPLPVSGSLYYRRDLDHSQHAIPVSDNIIYLLTDYIKLAPYLDVLLTYRISRPTLRYPDVLPNNILINTSNDVGDPLSETLSKPEVKLPENFDQLGHEE